MEIRTLYGDSEFDEIIRYTKGELGTGIRPLAIVCRIAAQHRRNDVYDVAAHTRLSLIPVLVRTLNEAKTHEGGLCALNCP